MSTRASAPRCASCGMPLAPDAESCAVCGARVPLIARPTTSEDEGEGAATGDASGVDPAPAAPPSVPTSAPDGASLAPATASSRTTPTTALPGLAAPEVRPAHPEAARDETLGTAGGPTSAHAPVPPAPTVPAAPVPAGPPAQAARPGGGRLTFDASAAAQDVRAAAGARRPTFTPPLVEGPAGIGRRMLAYAVDVVVAAVAASVGLLLARLGGSTSVVVPLVLGVVVAVGQVLLEGLRGRTVGALVTGIRTVDERTGAAPGVPRAFVRQLLVGLGVLACGVGNWVVAASGAWDSGPRRRGWHDKATGTAVLATVDAAPAPAAGEPRRTSPTGARAATSVASPEPRPWTPSPAPTVAPAPSADDALFAPPPPVVAVSAGPDDRDAAAPAPAAPTPEDPAGVRAASPDASPSDAAGTDVRGQAEPAPADASALVPEAPGAATSTAPTPPASPDLLPPPPAGTRRDRSARHTPAPPQAPTSAPDDDALAELEHTRVRDPESLRRRTGTLALSFDTGERVRVVGRGLVGRGPRAEDGQDILHVVVLQDAARSLSRVHVEFGPEPPSADGGGAIWVTDRGSTNGTVVVDPDGAARVLPPGTRAVVQAGWTVRLGDREARVEDD